MTRIFRNPGGAPLLLWLIFFLRTLNLHATDWPQEMGPERTGYTPEELDFSQFPEDGTPTWSADAGMGAAPAAVVGDRIYLTGYFHQNANLSDGVQESDRAIFAKDNELGQDVEYPRPGNPEINDTTPGKTHGGPSYLVDEYALCYDLKSGKLLWATRLQDEVAINHYYYTRATPLLVEGRIFIHTFNARLFALATEDGRLEWSRDLYEDGGATLGKGGNWCGPLLSAGKVVVTFAHDNKTTHMFAAEPQSGEKAWMTVIEESSFRPAKTSITLGDVDGKPTIVQSCGHYTVGIDPANGERRWVFDYAKELSVPTEELASQWRITWPGRIPFVQDGVVIDSPMVGYKNDWAFTHAFTVENGEIRNLWHHKFPHRCFGQYVVKGGFLYGLDQITLGGRPESVNRPDDMGAFQCVDIRSGEKAWISDSLDDIAQYGSLKDGNPHYIIAGNTAIFHQHNGLIYGSVTPETAGPFTFVELDRLAPKGLALPTAANGYLVIRRMGGDPSMHRGEPASVSANTLLGYHLNP